MLTPTRPVPPCCFTLKITENWPLLFTQWSDTIVVMWGLERQLHGSDLGELCLQNPTVHLEPQREEEFLQWPRPVSVVLLVPLS